MINDLKLADSIKFKTVSASVIRLFDGLSDFSWGSAYGGMVKMNNKKRLVYPYEPTFIKIKESSYLLSFAQVAS